MNLNIRTIWDVRVFTVTLTGLVILASVLLQALMLPPDLVAQVRWPGVVITFILATPIVYSIGLRMYDIYLLNRDRLDNSKLDALTGLLNRRSFLEKIQYFASFPGAIIMADIDHFKSYNDQHGHAMGDAAIKRVAQTFMRHCRAEDLVARYGGEEFMIFLSDAGHEEGVEVAERLRRTLAAELIEHDGHSLGITASFGVATLDHEEDVERAIARADSALYQSKHQGRNRVTAAS
ncbi:MAG: GGDEF domain-containing protein [Pseudomonadota bacterium]